MGYDSVQKLQTNQDSRPFSLYSKFPNLCCVCPRLTKCPVASCSTDSSRGAPPCREVQDISSLKKWINHRSFTEQTKHYPFSLSLSPPFSNWHLKIQVPVLSIRERSYGNFFSWEPSSPSQMGGFCWGSLAQEAGKSRFGATESTFWTSLLIALSSCLLAFPSFFTFLSLLSLLSFVSHPDLASIWNSKQFFNFTKFSVSGY